MPAFDVLRHLDPAQARARASVGTSTVATPASKSEGFLDTAFDDLLDIVNPLQHLPVVGTIYRAITHDQIGTVSKIAGDALYGGLWGAVGAVADAAFEAVTGKDFGSTMLALAGDALGLDHDDKPVQVAAAQPQSQAFLPASGAANTADAALATAMAARGMDTELASRAMNAYRRANGLVPPYLN